MAVAVQRYSASLSPSIRECGTTTPKRSKRFSLESSHNYSPSRPLQPDEKLTIYKEYCYQHNRKECPYCFVTSPTIPLCILFSANSCIKPKQIKFEDANKRLINDISVEKTREVVQIPPYREIYKKQEEKWKCPKDYIEYNETFEELWENKVEYLADSEDEKFIENFYPVFDSNKKKRKYTCDLTYRMNLFDLIIDLFEKTAIILLLRSERYLYMNDRRRKENCEICNSVILYNSDRDHTVLNCKKCNISVHCCCYYGERNESFEKKMQKKTTEWLCDYCSSSPEVFVEGINQCILCSETGGALKRAKHDKNLWCHILCALWIPETSLYLQKYFSKFPFHTILHHKNQSDYSSSSSLEYHYNFNSVNGIKPTLILDSDDEENESDQDPESDQEVKKSKKKKTKKKSTNQKYYGKLRFISGIETIKKSRSTLICYICRKKKGVCLECGDDGCRKAFHVSCARRNGNFVEVISSPQLQPKFVAYCKSHSLEHWTKEKNEEWESFILDREENLEKILSIVMENEHLKNISKATLEEVLDYWVMKRRNHGKPLLSRLQLIKMKEESEKYTENQIQRDYIDLFKFRQKMENVRILVDLSTKRERLKNTLLETQIDAFEKQLASVMLNNTTKEKKEKKTVKTKKAKPIQIKEKRYKTKTPVKVKPPRAIVPKKETKIVQKVQKEEPKTIKKKRRSKKETTRRSTRKITRKKFFE